MYCERCGKQLKDNEVCDCLPTNNLNQEYQEFNNNQQVVLEDPKKNNWKVILTAIIYPLLVLIAGLVIPGVQLLPLLGALALCAGFSVFMFLGGFYLFIIPLPVIYLFTYGSCKPELSLGKKILYGILAAVCLIGAIAMLFIR